MKFLLLAGILCVWIYVDNKVKNYVAPQVAWWKWELVVLPNYLIGAGVALIAILM